MGEEEMSLERDKKREEKILITSKRKLIAEDRKRLLMLKATDETWWKGEMSDWAREIYGENLIENSAETIASILLSLTTGEVVREELTPSVLCEVCGGQKGLDEPLIMFTTFEGGEDSWADTLETQVCVDCLNVALRKAKEFKEKVNVMGERNRRGSD